MLTIAFSSDNHLDVNRVAVDDVAQAQAKYLRDHQVDYYINTGDTFNDFHKTLHFFEKLQSLVGLQTQVYFIAGNHDMRHGVTYDELNQSLSPLYINHRLITIPHTNYAIIGNNGWYDYSFADQFLMKKSVSFKRWKKALWFDGMIKQPLSDAQRLAVDLNDLRNKLTYVRQHQMQAIIATHFVPHQNFMIYGYDRPQWDMINAYLGSRKTEALLNEYHDVVKVVAFGHLHLRDYQQMIADILYIHRPVGYQRGRLNEWQSHDFMTEWRNTLTKIYLPQN
ncbi:MAG: metallophosphoesterase [Candidatus Paralactobacillus gallistercoris]|uniref:Metallophosphoesterase n=1 Tax=Candidatus Paralactobacillus gallistercoris TaxID=2838724 RepID=A0A948TJY6_9LACO|nr:metallophosphoesterase [Candidatus Paralactobacillus gallistercoris]